jgi:hypothetical protein
MDSASKLCDSGDKEKKGSDISFQNFFSVKVLVCLFLDLMPYK